MKKLNKTKEDLIPCGVAMSSFVSDKSKTIGVLPLKITMDDQTRVKAFYVVESNVDYNILLGRHGQKFQYTQLMPITRKEGVVAMVDLMELLLAYWAEDSLMQNLAINLIKFQDKSDGDDVLTIDDLDPAPTEMEDSHPEV
ncbi:hypothetical protein L3X38_015305 [Prunus dulcis]|uniref:Uncharacterized protein n=1 Tax=Prunus dulcis TaxID=3755 RepID=A0AAD4WQF0_PRUDU|nr:hypothetical protein L3X38_015305 [Prunus dulcis]